MGKKNYYVVYEGRNPGVYESWPACQEQVSGYSNNCYKGYNTPEAVVRDLVQVTQPAIGPSTAQPPPAITGPQTGQGKK